MFSFLKKLFPKRDNALLKDALDQNAFLVDVRSPAEFANGSVSGAVNIPLNVLSGRWEELKNHKNIVVFCASGHRSGVAKRILTQKGLEKVVNGGSWKNVAQIRNT